MKGFRRLCNLEEETLFSYYDLCLLQLFAAGMLAYLFAYKFSQCHCDHFYHFSQILCSCSL